MFFTKRKKGLYTPLANAKLRAMPEPIIKVQNKRTNFFRSLGISSCKTRIENPLVIKSIPTENNISLFILLHSKGRDPG